MQKLTFHFVGHFDKTEKQISLYGSCLQFPSIIVEGNLIETIKTKLANRLGFEIIDQDKPFRQDITYKDGHSCTLWYIEVEVNKINQFEKANLICVYQFDQRNNAKYEKKEKLKSVCLSYLTYCVIEPTFEKALEQLQQLTKLQFIHLKTINSSNILTLRVRITTERIQAEINRDFVSLN